jgi:hypothetical protein
MIRVVMAEDETVAPVSRIPRHHAHAFSARNGASETLRHVNAVMGNKHFWFIALNQACIGRSGQRRRFHITA